MRDQRTTITPTRPAAPAWVLAIGAMCLVLAMLLTAYGPSRFDPAPTVSVGDRAAISGTN